jgi:hypothetical protein
MKAAAQTLVMMPPMGKIKICVPGRVNGWAVGEGELIAEELVAEGLIAEELVALDKTPVRKAASLDERVVLAAVPDAVDAERVTTGVRRF